VPIDCSGADGSFDIYAGGYVCAGPWKGYAWTNAKNAGGGTVEPDDYSHYVGGESQLCAEGILAMDYDSVGILGISLNQQEHTTTVGTWTQGSYTAVYVDFDNPGGSEVRLQVQSPGGGDAYCAESVLPGGDTVYFSELETSCWNGLGVTYAGGAIESIMLLVPGIETATVGFDFCLNEIYPVDSGSSSSCYSDEFECDNGQCIPFYYYCDGYIDCLDYSDEIC
jgi:hypothetical protein